MAQELETAQQHFIQGMSQICHYWGFPEELGALYGNIYLSAQPVSREDLVVQAGLPDDVICTHLHTLERLGLVSSRQKAEDSKTYYLPEVDFGKVVRTVLREREQNDIDMGLRSVSESLEMVQTPAAQAADAETAALYEERLANMERFFKSIENLLATVIALDNLRSGSISRLFGSSNQQSE